MSLEHWGRMWAVSSMRGMKDQKILKARFGFIKDKKGKRAEGSLRTVIYLSTWGPNCEIPNYIEIWCKFL
ncbi:hypothetical protein AMTRI_Chr02g261040 [Amborella trichopoda]